MISKAEAFARQYHRDQLDKAGRPYTEHLTRVAGLVHFPDDPQAAKDVAWLHDILEDTKVGNDELRRHFPDHIVNAVVILSRFPTETYPNYILKIGACGYPLAIAVKIADLRDHLINTDVAAAHLVPRYVRALETLQ